MSTRERSGRGSSSSSSSSSSSVVSFARVASTFALAFASTAVGVVDAQHPSRSASSSAVNGVLYAPVPHSSSIENDFHAVRCYAAIAAEASRVLVLVDSPQASRTRGRPSVTDFVVPDTTTMQWRRVNQNDDARVRKGDLSWCADLSRHGAQLTAATATEALTRRFKNARRACVGAVSAASDCGVGNDNVRMVLTANVESMRDDLPSALTDLVNRGMIQESFNIPAVAMMGEDETDATLVSSVERNDGVALQEDDIGEDDSYDVTDAAAATVNTHEGHPETKLMTLTSSRMLRASKGIDSSRALIVFGISVGLVGIFINVFAHARHASKQDELACLMVDGVSTYATSSKHQNRASRHNTSANI
jgi:hypothetical protein